MKLIESYLKELLLCMNELFTLLHFTPHLLHLIFIGLPWNHIFFGLHLILHFGGLEKTNDYKVYFDFFFFLKKKAFFDYLLQLFHQH